MNSTALEALALLALLALAAVLGWAYRGDKDLAAIAATNASIAACLSGADAAAAALAKTQAKLQGLREQHDQALAAANTAIADRNAEIKTLNQAATDRANHIVQSPHDDPNCKALADLPVCAAVARRLWPVRPQAGANGGHAPDSD